ncbi:MAG: hypothetical protein KJ949_00645, partial [Nanoarchaeota archaeon]|nr:hypothetical protein [Nanoarchaeota archaeon]
MIKIPFFVTHEGVSLKSDVTLVSSDELTDSGIDVNLLYKYVKGDSTGFNITGFVKQVDEDYKGCDITG